MLRVLFAALACAFSVYAVDTEDRRDSVNLAESLICPSS